MERADEREATFFGEVTPSWEGTLLENSHLSSPSFFGSPAGFFPVSLPLETRGKGTSWVSPYKSSTQRRKQGKEG